MDQPAEDGEPLRALIERCAHTHLTSTLPRLIETILEYTLRTQRMHFLRMHTMQNFTVNRSSLSQPPATIDGHNPFDHAVHEVAQYCALLFKGNPKVIEPLYVSHRYCASGMAAKRFAHVIFVDSWRELAALRQHFMTQVTANQYYDYAKSQIGDVKDGKGVESKKFYHCIRLLKEALAIVTGGHPRVWWEGEEREKLLEIRSGKLTSEAMHAMVQQLRNEIEPHLKSLPATTDVLVVDAWLLRLRSKTLAPLSPQLTLASPRQGSLRALAEALLLKHNVKGTILCALPSGSRLHGTASSSSPHDWIGVFALPTAKLCSLTPPIRMVDSQGIDTVASPAYIRGGVLLEVNFVCALLKQGSLRLLEMLFMDPSVLADESYATFAWQALVEQRKSLVSPGAVRACLGMATSVLEKKAKEGTESAATEHAALYQAVRLVLEAEHLLKEGQPRVHWKGNTELEAARRGVGSEQALQKLRALNEQMKKTKGNTGITGALNKWAVTIRKELHSALP